MTDADRVETVSGRRLRRPLAACRSADTPAGRRTFKNTSAWRGRPVTGQRFPAHGCGAMIVSTTLGGASVIRAAISQTTWTGDKDSMLDRHEQFARDAAEQGAQVMCFQELFYGPYFGITQDKKYYRY